VWVGQPSLMECMKSTFKLQFLVRFWIIFFIIWIVFGLALVASIFSLLICVGLCFLISKKKVLKTVYMVTNLRAISFDGTGARKFISYYPVQLKNFEKQRNLDGSGNIIFKTEIDRDTAEVKRIRGQGFMAIKDVNRVGDLLEKLANMKDGKVV